MAQKACLGYSRDDLECQPKSLELYGGQEKL